MIILRVKDLWYLFLSSSHSIDCFHFISFLVLMVKSHRWCNRSSSLFHVINRQWIIRNSRRSDDLLLLSIFEWISSINSTSMIFTREFLSIFKWRKKIQWNYLIKQIWSIFSFSHTRLRHLRQWIIIFTRKYTCISISNEDDWITKFAFISFFIVKIIWKIWKKKQNSFNWNWFACSADNHE